MVDGGVEIRLLLDGGGGVFSEGLEGVEVGRIAIVVAVAVLV